MNNNALKNKTVFFYGILGIPIAFLGFPLYIYLPTFYVQTVGLNIGDVGFILLIARIIDMIFDPFIGHFSDKYFSRFNLILFSVFIVLFGIYFLIKPLYFTPLWLFVFSIITYISYSLIVIPYLTLNSELSKNSFDNTKLSFSREIFTIIGVLIALLIPYIFQISHNPKESLELLLYILLILFPAITLIFYFTTKEEKKKKETSNDFFKSLNKFFNTFPNHKKLFMAFLINNLANALPATLFLFFVKYVLNLESNTGLFLIIYFSSAIITFKLWINLSKRITKINTWITSILISSTAFIFVPFLQEGDFFYFILVCIFTGICLGADMAIPSSIQSDIAQESKKLNNDISGVLFGFWAMITKLSLAFAVAISFGVLELVSFDIKDITQVHIFTLIILYSIVPIIFKLISVLLLLKYKPTNNHY